MKARKRFACRLRVSATVALLALGLFVTVAISATLLGRADFNNLATRSACAAAIAVAVALTVLWTAIQSRRLLAPGQSGRRG